MKKSLIALAALAASAAFAQSSVTLYGLAAIGVNSTNGGKANLAGGADGTDSRWGVRGTEDMGGGLSAGFVFESGFKPDTGNFDNTVNQLFQRQAFVSMNSTSLGQVRLGRQYTLGFNSTIDSMPSTYTDVALATGLGFGGMGSRNSDQIQYRSPSFGGFAVHLSTQLGGDTNQAATAAAKNTEARLAYANGPLAVNVSTASVKNTNGTTSSPVSLNAAYDFGAVKLFGGYIDTDRTTGTTVGKGYVVKAYAPMGAHALFVGYGKNDTTKADAYELGDYYSLSKRTKLYAIYANGSKDFTGASGIANGKRWALGVQHAF